MKKIWIIIVEGISDKNALEGILKNILSSDQNAIFIVTYDSDILTSTHPILKTTNKVKEIAQRQKLLISDITRIIQISDIDGCYIDNTLITQKDLEKVKYLDNGIECSNKDCLIQRNEQKRININMLKNRSSISFGKRNIKYSLYFFSCNIDHVLHRERNLDPFQKVTMAKKFALRYDGKEYEFIPFAKSLTHNLSNDNLFEWIKEELHSLEKSSNIFYLLSEEEDGN